MVLLGVLGLFQAALLPGLALISLFPSDRAERLRASEVLAFGIGLSLAFNHGAVLLLTWAGLNVPGPHFLSMAAGALAVGRAFLVRRPWSRETLLPVLMVCLAGLVLLVSRYLLSSQGFCIFRGGDELFSWNAWAIQWAGNQFPTNTRHYPQLLPAAWSVIYQFLPKPVDFFAKALMPMFTLGIAAIFIAFWRLEKRPGPLLSLPIGLFLIYCFGWSGSLMLMGMADVPSAFTLLLAYYTYSKWRAEPGDGFYLFLSGVFAGTAAIAKQGGLALLPFFLVAFLEQAASAAAQGVARAPSSRPRLSAWLPFWLAFAAVAVPWYLYAEHQVAAGRNHYDRSEEWLVNHGATFFQPGSTALARLSSAYQALASSLHGQAVVWVLAVLCLLSLRDKRHRGILLLMGFGYPLVWALFLSYDLRNLTPAAPFMALGAGAVLGDALQRPLALARASAAARFPAAWGAPRAALRAAFPSAARSAARVGLLVTALGITLLSATCPEAKVLDSLERLRIAKIGDSAQLNSKLYSYLGSREPNDTSKIASYYPFLSAMPGLAERFEKVDLRNDGALESVVKDPAVGYVLLVFNLHWHLFVSDENMEAVKRLQQAGTLEPVFEIPDGSLLRVKGARL